MVTVSSVRRALVSIGWSKKVARNVAKNGTPTYETSMSTIYQHFTLISLCMWTSLAATKGQALDVLASLHSAWRRFKPQSSTAVHDTKSCRLMLKMALCCHEYSKDQRIAKYLKTLSSSCFSIVADSQLQSLYLLWTMPHFITVNA